MRELILLHESLMLNIIFYFLVVPMSVHKLTTFNEYYVEIRFRLPWFKWAYGNSQIDYKKSSTFSF